MRTLERRRARMTLGSGLRPSVMAGPRSTPPGTARSSKTGALVRALTLMGFASLALAAFQVRIGDISERRSQRELRSSFQQVLATGAGLGKDAQGQPKPIATGSAVALLEIPKLGVRKVVVEGSGADELKRGPGLLQSSPIPGQAGHSIVAGRRTTYGAPFRRLQLLAASDPIRMTTPYGRFTYSVRDVQTVRTGTVARLSETPGSLLTLLTSDPPNLGGAALAVNATLEGKPSAFPDPPRQSSGKPGGVSFAGNAGAGPAAAAFGILLLAALLVADNLYRHWRRWPTYLLTTPVILALLLMWMESVSSLLTTTL